VYSRFCKWKTYIHTYAFIHLYWINMLKNRRLFLSQPSPSELQSNHAPHGFSFSPHSRDVFQKDKHLFCVKSLSLGTNEFQCIINKDNDVSQNLITGILRRSIFRVPKEYDSLKRDKKPYNLLTYGAIFQFRYEHDFAYSNLTIENIYCNNSMLA